MAFKGKTLIVLLTIPLLLCMHLEANPKINVKVKNEENGKEANMALHTKETNASALLLSATPGNLDSL